jgi:hypothetical protein
MGDERELTDDELRVLREAEGFLLNALDRLSPWAKPAPRPRQRKPRVAPPDGLRNAQEAAAKLGCSIKTLKAHVASGALRYVNIGRGSKRQSMRFTDHDLDTFITNQSQTKEQPCPSTKTHARPTGSSISAGEVIAFSAQQRPRPAAMRKR